MRILKSFKTKTKDLKRINQIVKHQLTNFEYLQINLINKEQQLVVLMNLFQVQL
jgi:hypothetical protein